MKTSFALVCAMFLLVSAAHAETTLVSRPPGDGALSADLFAWNHAGALTEEDDFFTRQNASANGRYVVFNSEADGLAPGEDPAFSHVLLKDMTTDALTVIDVGANGDSVDPDISDDGRYVVFASRASNLDAADGTHDTDVFSKDLQTGVVTLLSSAGDHDDCVTCVRPVISGNGQKVAFATAAAMVSTDTNGNSDVYVMPTSGGTPPVLASASSTLAASNGSSFQPSLTDDAGRVAYVSTGTDINNGNDPTNDPDLYVRSLSGVGSLLASGQNGNNFGIAAGGVRSGEISGDGSTVVFADTASYLAADGDSHIDVYMRVLATKADTLISVDTSGTKADRDATSPAVDGNGGHVAFVSSAANLGPGGSGRHLFVRDTAASTTTAITAGDDSTFFPALAHGGAYVVFVSDSALSDAPGPFGVHRASVAGTGLTLASRPATGPALTPGLTSTMPPDTEQDDRRVSADGRYVVFASDAPALGGPAGTTQCWRRDLTTGQLLRVSTGDGPVSFCDDPTISADGRRVAFATTEPLEQADFGGTDVYVHDIPTGSNTLVTRADGAGGDKSDGNPHDTEISGDGKHVAFVSTAHNLGVPTGGAHVYLRDLTNDTTHVADLTTAGDLPPSEAVFAALGVNADGSRVAFSTTAPLDPAADTDTRVDVYVRDLAAGTTTLVSRQSDSAGGAKGDEDSRDATISSDGRRVAFTSRAQNLVPALSPWPAGGVQQLFIRDLAARTTTMASTAADGKSAGDGYVFAPSLDATGATVAFGALRSPVTNVTVRDVATNADLAVIQPDPIGGGGLERAFAARPALSADCGLVTYYARGRNVFPGMSPDFTQLYARELDGSRCASRTIAGGGSGAGTSPPRVRPVLSGVSMTSRRFKVGKKRTAVSAKLGTGTTFRFKLNETATVAIRIDRLVKGRHGKKKRVRAKKIGTLTRRGLAAGGRKVPFSGRIGKRKLAPGNYRATLVATASGLGSKPVALRFKVVRR
jgi:Tol biopolymer transport system component